MLATIPGIDGKKHWVNIYQIIASSRLALFGGKTVFTPNTIRFWNPATGLTESTSSILDFKVFRF